MNKVSLYIPEACAGAPRAPYFVPPPESMTYRDVPPSFFDTSVERVSSPALARAIVLPNNFKSISPEIETYIKQYADAGEKAGIPVFVFSLGDFTDSVRFDPRVWVFRLSVYRSSMGPRDIVMPTTTEDHGRQSVVIRTKQAKPLVSFCGMGGFPSWSAWIKYYLKLAYYDFLGMFNPIMHARKVGVYWRRRAMRACERSPLVDTHFIIRRSFSGNRKTIELDPKVARREYLESIINADFVLAPKGDGNYSNRFLKTLSLGRIPVLIDTESILPFEGDIDYTKVVVRVPMQKVSETPRYIKEFYEKMDDAEYGRRQHLAREVFERYLRSDSFFEYFFTQKLQTLV